MSKSFRPTLHRLEDRMQPGSAVMGLDASLLAGSLLGDGLVSSSDSVPVLTQSDGSSSQSVAQVDQSTAIAVSAQPVTFQSQNNLASQSTTLNQVLFGASTTALGGVSDHFGNGDNGVRTPGGTIYYGGDCDHINGLANEFNSIVSDARVYDNFIVSSTMNLVTVFGKDYNSYSPLPTMANWEIRSGVAAGTGGTLIASGQSQPATVTPDGCNDFGFTGYQIAVSIPQGSVVLGPGTYYLNVTPIGSGNGRSFVETTSGLNAAGSNVKGDTWFDSDYYNQFFPAHWISTSNPNLLGSGSWNFSTGVSGRGF